MAQVKSYDPIIKIIYMATIGIMSHCLFYFTEQDLHELGPGLNPRSTYLKRKGMIRNNRTSNFHR